MGNVIGVRVVDSVQFTVLSGGKQHGAGTDDAGANLQDLAFRARVVRDEPWYLGS